MTAYLISTPVRSARPCVKSWRSTQRGYGIGFSPQRAGLAPLADWMIQEGITIYYSVPTVFRHFVRTLTGTETFPRLRLIRLGGEPVSKHDVELFKARFPQDCLFVNALPLARPQQRGSTLLTKRHPSPAVGSRWVCGPGSGDSLTR